MSSNEKPKALAGRTMQSCISMTSLDHAPLLYLGSPTSTGEGPFVVVPHIDPASSSSCASSPRGLRAQGGSGTSPSAGGGRGEGGSLSRQASVAGTPTPPTQSGNYAATSPHPNPGGNNMATAGSNLRHSEAAVIDSRPVAVAVESWEFRKLFPDGSVPPHAMFAADVNQDGNTELVLGMSEGQLAVLRPGRRECLSLDTFAATISVLVHCPASNRIVVVTLEGLCEVRRMNRHNQSEVERRFAIPPNCSTASALSMEGVPERLFLGTDRGVFVYDLEKGGDPLAEGAFFSGSTIVGVKVVGVPVEETATTMNAGPSPPPAGGSRATTNTKATTTRVNQKRYTVVTILTVAAMDGVRMWEAGDATLLRHQQTLHQPPPVWEVRCCDRCGCATYIRGETTSHATSPNRTSGGNATISAKAPPVAKCNCDTRRIVAIDATPVCGLSSFFQGGSGMILVTLSQYGIMTMYDVALLSHPHQQAAAGASPTPTHNSFPTAVGTAVGGSSTNLATTSASFSEPSSQQQGSTPLLPQVESPYSVRVTARHHCELRRPMLERVFLQQAVQLPPATTAAAPVPAATSSMMKRLQKVVDSTDSIRAVALSTDGVCLVLSTSSTTAVTQLRADACSFSVAPTFTIPALSHDDDEDDEDVEGEAPSPSPKKGRRLPKRRHAGSGPILSIQYASIDLLIDYVVAQPEHHVHHHPHISDNEASRAVRRERTELNEGANAEQQEEEEEEGEEERQDREYLEDRWSHKERALLLHIGQRLYPELILQGTETKSVSNHEGPTSSDGEKSLPFRVQRKLCDLVEALCSSASPIAIDWMTLHSKAEAALATVTSSRARREGSAGRGASPPSESYES